MFKGCKGSTIAGVLTVAVALSVSPARAQFGGIKKLGSKIKDATVGGVNGVANGVSGHPSADKPNPEEFADSSGTYSKLKDGEAALVPTALSELDATAKVKAYFNSKDIDFTVNADTGRIVSDWYGEHRCGVGFNRCANRAMVRVATESGKTVIRVQVFERKREGGINEKPWKENSTSQGKETGVLAVALAGFISQ